MNSLLLIGALGASEEACIRTVSQRLDIQDRRVETSEIQLFLTAIIATLELERTEEYR